jgi:hypothetical protein
VTSQWFSPGTTVSFTNKTDRHDAAEILLKVALNTRTLKPYIHKQYNTDVFLVGNIRWYLLTVGIY